MQTYLNFYALLLMKAQLSIESNKSYHKLSLFNLGSHYSNTSIKNYIQITINTGFLVAQVVKNLPALWETLVLSLGWEDPPEEGMATHSSILTWRILMDWGAWHAKVHGVTKSQMQLSD